MGACVGGDGHFAKALRVADRTTALESGRLAVRGHQHVARPAVLALLAAGRARVFELAEFAYVFRGATEMEKNDSISCVS